ncbi:MAG: squalene--hopene cyclase [Syntrophobacteraceae bacterium]
MRVLLLDQQSTDGSWRYLLQGSVMPDSYAILAESLFPPAPSGLVESLATAIERRQLPNGGFELYPGQCGDFSTTLEAYMALRVAGRSARHPVLVGARDFLAGVSEPHLSNLTRVTLAALGIISWRAVPSLPPEVMLLPGKAPFSLYDLASYSRVHMPAIMLLSAIGATRDFPLAEEVQGLLSPRHVKVSPACHPLFRPAQWLLSGQSPIGKLSWAIGVRKRAVEACRRFICDRLEADGTLGSYLLSTIFSMLALTALGRPDDQPLVNVMKQGLRSFLFEFDGELHMQPCTSTVWDTALNVALLRSLGVEDTHEAISRGISWLLEREITSFPDLWQHSPGMCGSAWGFQAVNRFYPDVDDTCAVLGAIDKLKGHLSSQAAESFARGVDWVFHMQNKDGGFSAFDVNCSKTILEHLPFNDMRRAMIDPSSADMTGRTLAFLSLLADGRAALARRRAIAWLDGNQERCGAWWGRWGISYLYGTWAALLGYGAAGIKEDDSHAVARGCKWLRSVQNPDGGWGESCRSDLAGCFVPRSPSTPSQTAWALEGLLAAGFQPQNDPAVKRGAEFLLQTYQPGVGWKETYPTGAAFAGRLYLVYHNYRNLWPAMALLRASREGEFPIDLMPL